MPKKHPLYDDPKIDWRYRALLRGAERLWCQQIEASKKPEGFRDDQGNRRCWSTELPTDEARAEARAAAGINVRAKALWADCPCCMRRYAIPSQVASIQDEGLCGMCKLFEEGKVEGVILHRPPTLTEALEAPPHDIRPAEALVLRQALLAEIRSISP